MHPRNKSTKTKMRQRRSGSGQYQKLFPHWNFDTDA